MSDVAVDELLRSFDALVGTVYWSEEPVTLDAALTEAIEDWVATTAAERHESTLFCSEMRNNDLAAALVHMAAAVDAIANGNLVVTMASALSDAVNDWVATPP